MHCGNPIRPADWELDYLPEIYYGKFLRIGQKTYGSWKENEIAGFVVFSKLFKVNIKQILLI